MGRSQRRPRATRAGAAGRGYEFSTAVARRLRARLERGAFPCPASGCVLWAGEVSKAGYGRLKLRKKNLRVHRLAWVLERGPIPAGLFVCHHCDVPSCFSSTHLFLGTAAENVADRVRKGRHSRPRNPRYALGEACGAAKLTKSKIIAIRRSRLPSTALARRFGVNKSTVIRARNGKLWAHVE